ncbi:unnamed protein product [Nippostrongylus brasiliensis]|uniref:DUF4058 family protein n=1 Tax=Nippostrongylus brasiliensis TaxID=27835 RepID=A0A0N4XSF7_NIPBR|nr:unnamed protein product [Nippostrongylus brasiliensis]
MLDHTRLPGTIHRDQDVFLALPPPFARLNAEVDYPSHVVPFVYPDWSALAQKMIAMPITTSVIIVWPESTPESRQMRQVLIALERHLQCGGTMAFFPSPYHDDNAKEWAHMGRICAEFVKYMTAPERAFDAIVRDHYSDVLEQAPYSHPAMCLGTRPRKGNALLSADQVVLFLKKLRVTVSDLIRIDEFDYASPELKEHRRREKLLKERRRKEEHKPNFWVIQDPRRRRQQMKITFRDPRHDSRKRRRLNDHSRAPQQSYNKSPSRNRSPSCSRRNRSGDRHSHRTDPMDARRKNCRDEEHGCTRSRDRGQTELPRHPLSDRTRSMNRGDSRGGGGM